MASGVGVSASATDEVGIRVGVGASVGRGVEVEVGAGVAVGVATSAGGDAGIAVGMGASPQATSASATASAIAMRTTLRRKNVVRVLIVGVEYTPICAREGIPLLRLPLGKLWHRLEFASMCKIALLQRIDH